MGRRHSDEAVRRRHRGGRVKRMTRDEGAKRSNHSAGPVRYAVFLPLQESPFWEPSSFFVTDEVVDALLLMTACCGALTLSGRSERRWR